MRLREHTVTLQGDRVALRPLTEMDWDLLLRWNSDAEVLYYADGDDVAAYTVDEVQAIYRTISQTAYCFVIEVARVAIGEAWLQQMNLRRILERHPNADCRRIDLMIGEKRWWGRGIGTETIRLLTDYAFEHEGAGLVFGCDIADYNPGSVRAFTKVGYTLDAEVRQAPGAKATICYDLIRRREDWLSTRRT